MHTLQKMLARGLENKFKELQTTKTNGRAVPKNKNVGKLDNDSPPAYIMGKPFPQNVKKHSYAWC